MRKVSQTERKTLWNLKYTVFLSYTAADKHSYRHLLHTT